MILRKEKLGSTPSMARATPRDTRVGLPWGIRPVVPQATPSRILAPRQRSMEGLGDAADQRAKNTMAIPLPPVTTEPMANHQIAD